MLRRRGFAEAAAVLGPDFAGVLVRDGWVAYRGFKKAPHQTCLAHLLRRCKDLQAAHPDSPWAGAVQAVLRDGLALRTRSNAGEISEHGLASARGRLAAARPADRHRAAVGRRRALRQALGIPGGVPLLVRPVDRPPTGGPNRPSDPQWSRVRSAAATAPGAGPTPSKRRAYRPPTQPRPALADHDDAVRPRTRRARSACVAAARLTPGGVETAHPLPVLLRAPGALNPRRPAAARARDPWVSPPAAGTPPGSSPLFAASVPAACPSWRRRRRRDPRGLAPPRGTGAPRSRQTQR